MSLGPATPATNRLWADLIVEELLRSGVGLFCIAPGSRSTPLVAAVAANPSAKSLVHFDERGTAFAALGYARATGRPAAWITTSGTAVANGLPAVVEASVDAVPMILLTADRPPELRQTGANQTIDQTDIFGGYTRWKFDLPAPDPGIDPAMVLTTVDQAVYRARRAPRGPIHLNLMFREPLIPDPDTEPPDPAETNPALASWQTSGKPYTRYATTKPVVDAAGIRNLWEELSPVKRGLLVAGRLESRAEGAAVSRLAEALGWPLLPDIGSGVRLGGAGYKGTVHYYDALLSSEEFAAAHEPEAVLHVGGRSLSKRLEQLVGRSRPNPYAVIRESPLRLDPNHRVTHNIESDVTGFCDTLVEAVTDWPPKNDPGWTSSWCESSEAVERSIEDYFVETEQISEPLVARLVSRNIPEGHGLFLASSMPVRDADTYGATDSSGGPVAMNRGASGIDGTVASAVGFARGLGEAVTLLIGDLALLHDLNSLALLKNSPYPIVIVTLNNDGGGIFSFLPVAQHRDLFEPYFSTPQNLGFEDAAAMFGLRYEKPGTAADFLETYRAACSRGTSTLIEVTTDREENLALHRELQNAVAAGLTSR